MPDIPGRPIVRDKGGGQGIEVTWNAVLPNNTGSVLYLVQRRSYSGRHTHRRHVLDNNDTLTSPWQQIEQVQCQSLNDDGILFSGRCKLRKKIIILICGIIRYHFSVSTTLRKYAV